MCPKFSLIFNTTYPNEYSRMCAASELQVCCILNQNVPSCADGKSSPVHQTGTDVYAITEGQTQGPWTVRNVLMQPQAQQAESGIVARTVLVEVDDKPGVLNEVTGVVARRGYNIQSLAVGNCEQAGRSRITVVLPGTQGSVSKLMKQIQRLVVVQKVVDLTDTPHVVRELMLIRVLSRSIPKHSVVLNGFNP